MWAKYFKIPVTVVITTITTFAAVLKILDWFGQTRQTVQTWPSWLLTGVTVLTFAVAVGGITILSWWLWRRHVVRLHAKQVAYMDAILTGWFRNWKTACSGNWKKYGTNGIVRG